VIRKSAFAILLSAAFAIAQLNPALTPQKAPQPALPKVDENVCPGEGCQFGKWKALKRIQVYSTWKAGRKLVVTLSKGESVTAITGVNITFEPSEIRVTKDIPQYGLKVGDTVFGYMYLGEGFLNAWFNGTWLENFDGSMVDGINDSCGDRCTAKMIKPSRIEWWVKVKTAKGIVGWTKDTMFSGKDALGAPE
jgi:hypothetical protein